MAILDSKVNINIEKGESVYSFSMPQGAPCGEAYDACFEVLREILKMAGQIADQAEQKRKEEAKPKE